MFISVMSHFDRYLQEERNNFNYKRQNSQELVSLTIRYRIPQGHMSDVCNCVLC